MNFSKLILILSLGFSAVTVQAAAKKIDPPASYYNSVAAGTAALFNRFQTVENYNKWIATRIPESEMDGLKKVQKKIGLKPEQKFPKFTSEGNKVYFDKNNFMIINKDSVEIGSHVFKQSAKTMDQFVWQVFTTLTGKKTAGNPFIPEANAAFSLFGLNGTMSGGLAGLAIGALAGCIGAPMLFQTPQDLSCIVGAGGGAAVGAIIGSGVLGEMFSNDANEDGTTYHCDKGGGYVVCKPSGSDFNWGVGWTSQGGPSADASYGNNQDCKVADQTVMAQLNGGVMAEKCNGGNLGRYKRRMRDYPKSHHRTGPPEGATCVSGCDGSNVHN